MSRLLRVIAIAITASVSLPAVAGVDDKNRDAAPPAGASEAAPDDDGPVLPPWERPGADEPEAGVDDDPTPFDPAAGPTDPLPD